MLFIYRNFICLNEILVSNQLTSCLVTLFFEYTRQRYLRLRYDV